MDEIDRKILRAHQKEPELTMERLAERVGMAKAPCWRRLKKLREDGVIERVAVILNQNALGLGITAIANVKLERHHEETLDAFEREVVKFPEIIECFTTSGDSDYTLRIVARSIEDYEVFLKRKLANLPHVAAVNSSFAMKSVKLTTELPV